ncbi:unnamed protein product [Amoebophrya sp. A25]|nr:unnamed protein product [Amoebophrya sp. A25]|eukprot:GSA25T00007110001.1
MVDVPSCVTYEYDDGACTYISHEELDSERRTYFAKVEPEEPVWSSADVIYTVLAREGDGREREFFLHCPQGGAPALILRECRMTCDSVAPSELVQYQFEEPCSDWRIAPVAKGSLESYIAFKFKAWREQLEKPSCEAEFRRMLQNGLVTRIYDAHMFPTPEGLKGKYEVTDERNGKTLKLPHPVSGLRVWNAKSKSYESINPRLEGAPSEAEEVAYWTQLLEEFREKRGAEYIDQLIAGGNPTATPAASQ